MNAESTHPQHLQAPVTGPYQRWAPATNGGPVSFTQMFASTASPGQADTTPGPSPSAGAAAIPPPVSAIPSSIQRTQHVDTPRRTPSATGSVAPAQMFASAASPGPADTPTERLRGTTAAMFSINPPVQRAMPGDSPVRPPFGVASATGPVSFAQMFASTASPGPVEPTLESQATALPLSVQLDSDAAPETEPATPTTAPSSPGERGVSGVSGGPTSLPTPGTRPTDLEELARQLYEPLAARLKAELWLDRERAGLLTDR